MKEWRENLSVRRAVAQIAAQTRRQSTVCWPYVVRDKQVQSKVRRRRDLKGRNAPVALLDRDP
jgi:hypothetical protein